MKTIENLLKILYFVLLHGLCVFLIFSDNQAYNYIGLSGIIYLARLK